MLNNLISAVNKNLNVFTFYALVLHTKMHNIFNTFLFYETPLHQAVRAGNIDRMRALIAAGANVEAQGNYRNNVFFALLNAISNLNFLYFGVKCYLDQIHSIGRTPLQLAAMAFNLQAVELLLQSGANPNAGADENCPIFSPLSLVTPAYDPDLAPDIQELFRDQEAIITSLVAFGAKPVGNYCQELKHACRRSSPEIIVKFLQAKVAGAERRTLFLRNENARIPTTPLELLLNREDITNQQIMPILFKWPVPYTQQFTKWPNQRGINWPNQRGINWPNKRGIAQLALQYSRIFTDGAMKGIHTEAARNILSFVEGEESATSFQRMLADEVMGQVARYGAYRALNNS